MICFPGLERQISEPNPLYQGLGSVPRASPVDAPAEGEQLRGPPPAEEQSPPHGQHIADASSESDSSSDQTKCSTAPPKGGGREHRAGLNGQSNPQPCYTGESPTTKLEIINLKQSEHTYCRHLDPKCIFLSVLSCDHLCKLF